MMTYSSTDKTTIKICRNGGQPEWIRPEIIHIEPEDREQARCLSDPIHGESQQWSVYIHTLAFSTFIRWLDSQQRSMESKDVDSYTVDIEDCSLFNPAQANVLDAVCKLKINNFKFGLIAPENLLDGTFTISDLALRVPEFAAQFYLLIEVREEQDQVWFYGAASRTQIEEHLARHATTEELDGSNMLPLSIVQIDPHAIFSYLKRTVPEAIALPQVSPEGSQSFNKVLEQLYAQPKDPFALNVRLQQMVTLFSQTAVDVTQWVDNQIDKVAEQLGFWMADNRGMAEAAFLNSDADGSAGILSKRSVQHFENAIAWLKQNGHEISDEIKPRYQEITVGDISLYMCSLIIPVSQSDMIHNHKPNNLSGESCSDLLVLLSTPTGENLPKGIQLQLSTALHIVDEKLLDYPQPFLFSKAKIKPKEKILSTVIFGNKYAVGTSYYSEGNQEE